MSILWQFLPTENSINELVATMTMMRGKERKGKFNGCVTMMMRTTFGDEDQRGRTKFFYFSLLELYPN